MPSRWLLGFDCVLVAFYAVTAFVAHRRTVGRAERIEGIDPARFRPLAHRLARWSEAGLTWVLLAAVADLVENAIDATMQSGPGGKCALVTLQVATWLKWLGLVCGFITVALTAISAAIRTRDLRPASPDLWPAGRAPAPDAGWDPVPGKAGVCLSGGGIRSASFSLGALQAVARSELGGIRYVTSVSGGGYMAAAWAALTRPQGATAPIAATERRRPFHRWSPEERWVRHHTNYLISSGAAILGALVTVVGGLALNVLIVLLAFQAVAHPLGWAIGIAHPETRANTPIVEIVRQPGLKVGALVAVPDAEVPSAPAKCEACVPTLVTGPAYSVPLEWSGPEQPGLDLKSADKVSDTLKPVKPLPLLDIQPGLVAEGDKGLVVVRQPFVSVAPSSVSDEVAVSVQPKLTTKPLPEISGARPGGLTTSEVQGLVELDRQPTIRQSTGTAGRGGLKYQAWMVGLVLSILVAALLVRIGHRRSSRTRNRRVFALVKLAVVASVVVFAGPWLGHGLPGWLGHLPGYRPITTRWTAVGGFLLAAIPLLARTRGTLRNKVGFLKRFRGRPYVLDVVLGVFVTGIAVTGFVLLVDLASANGPSGRLAGLQDSFLPWPHTDAGRWLVELGLFAAVMIIPARWWSLYTVYRSRLGKSYFLKAEPESDTDPNLYRIAEMEAADQRAWQWAVPGPPPPPCGGDPQAPEDRTNELDGLSTAPDLDNISEWVVCTTANIRGAGEAAPGRRAGSFTFSKCWVGGPEVGWMSTPQYLYRLHDKRRRDVSVPSTVTISGAAFSPAMGKASLGWQGRLFALTNLRLGVWVANPMVVARGTRKCHFGRFRRPNVAWYLRELVGWFDRTAPYVYLTDGGHWENLGLVELLRRGCTDIWLISAAGDGPDSFETLAQALALAREEVEVEFDLEVEGLRATEKPVNARRRLLRDGVAVGTAPESFCTGRFRYSSGVTGTIHVIEAALLGDLPWDVHAYAEANSDFPDIATGYQLMDHRDFEAYRMLGYTQAARALHDAGLWPPDDGEP